MTAEGGTAHRRVVGIVLAGGRSRRFGRDKLAAEHRGRPLLEHPVTRLLELSDRVIVVLAHGADDPPIPRPDRVAFVRDEALDEGPLRGLSAGLAASGDRWAVVVGGDMPDLQAPVLLEMLRAVRETGAVAVALSDRGDARPLPIAIEVERAKAAVEALLREGKRSLRDLLASVRTVVVDEPTWTALDPGHRTLVDVDEVGDLDP